MLKLYFSKRMYSMYFMARRNNALSDFWLDICYMLASISFIYTLQLISIVSVISFFLVKFNRQSFAPEEMYYFIIFALIFLMLFMLLGGDNGIKETIKRYDSDQKFDAEIFYIKSLLKELLSTLCLASIGMACAYLEGKIIRGEPL